MDKKRAEAAMADYFRGLIEAAAASTPASPDLPAPLRIREARDGADSTASNGRHRMREALAAFAVAACFVAGSALSLSFAPRGEFAAALDAAYEDGSLAEAGERIALLADTVWEQWRAD
jgi:hypothetical protein